MPDEQSGEVGGIQNTVTNLGASIGTAVAGALLIAVLTSTLLEGVAQNPAVPEAVSTQATVELSSGVPFISDVDLDAALLDAGVEPAVAAAIVEENAQARLVGLRAALAALAVVALLALCFDRKIPAHPSSSPTSEPGPDPEPADAKG